MTSTTSPPATTRSRRASIYADTSLLLALPVLRRGLEPFPVPLRTLDALHLATVEHLRSRRLEVRLASYDARMLRAAEAMAIPRFPLQGSCARYPAAMRAASSLCAAFVAAALFASAATADAELPRIVSLNPSLTQILLALDAQAALVGVDQSSAQLEPRVRELPRVGGLFNPSLEAIAALAPDFVMLVPSAQQRGLRERLAALDIEVLELRNHGLDDLLASIEVLGVRVGRGAEASARSEAIRAAFRAAESRERSAAAPRAVLVIQRDPLYVVGGGSYLDTMLRAAGADNIAAEFDEAYPRVSVEWLIAAAPELILDVSDPVAGAQSHWQRWPSLPAVAGGQVHAIDDSGLTMPGPHLDRALARLIEHIDRSAP